MVFPASWGFPKMWFPKVWFGNNQDGQEAFIRKCGFLGPIPVLLQPRATPSQGYSSPGLLHLTLWSAAGNLKVGQISLPPCCTLKVENHRYNLLPWVLIECP